jgi:transposase InsO family protein
VHHSDQGVQYASREYIEKLREHQMLASMSRPGNPYDNATCESFIKTVKQEEIYVGEYRDFEDLLQRVEEFIDRYYNPCRLHSALGYCSPQKFEAQRQVESRVLAAGILTFLGS